MQKKQKKEQVQREGVGTSLARMLLLPESSLTGSVRIECNANREAVVEGCSGILEYSDETIRLTTGRMVLRFSGRGLSINGMAHGYAVVTGNIASIEFVT